jgi:predicted HAD superfamily Cof-like phosphohydrolase
METVNSIKAWFDEAVPAPTKRNQSVQTGVHLEEVGEMLMSFGEVIKSHLLDQWGHQLKTGEAVLIDNIDRTELLDSLCDQIVTAIGVAHMFGMDIAGALNEVDESNWSKFMNGVAQFDANGKIAKAASYVKPNLLPFMGVDPCGTN